ncbi:hypothetical protein [Peribacillus frigoritolerans]|uniref:hypothetical protein n=1 Tax=Peribacillus frigoritolerans TaxID=450367 RepID=UPI0020797037|nr:hypothetical protein [Peribacillus frigoritolerans]USK75610.1 hypothetical protein LIT31_03185 [Peribacillus frigoritolerans]
MKKQEKGLKNQFDPEDMIEKMIDISSRLTTINSVMSDPEKMEKPMKEIGKERWDMDKSDFWSTIVLGLVQ